MDTSCDIIYGQPYGGVAVTLLTKVAPQSRRICAISLKTDIDVLIINCYKPCDSRSYHVDNEFEECLDEMYMLVSSYQDKAIIGGDFNVDISRNTGHALLLQQFCFDLSLHFMWDHSKVNSSFTYESFDSNARSTIYHIICSTDPYRSIIDRHARHDVDNLSNHNVIVVNFKYALSLTSRHLTSFPADSTSWKRAKDYDVAYYMKCLDKHLQSICVPPGQTSSVYLCTY